MNKEKSTTQTLDRIEAEQPCYPEFIAVLIAGTLHVATELLVSPASARVFNVVVVLAFLVYLVWRAIGDKTILRAWGMRTDNFWSSAHAFAAFGVPSAALLYGYGVMAATAPLPRTFWLILFLYPAWGIAQQFALQNLIGRNLLGLVKPPVLHALVTTTLFSASHFPNDLLMALTFVAGFAFTLLYRRWPNLWAIGIAHGFLGAMAYYLVLGEDAVVELRQFLDAQNP